MTIATGLDTGKLTGNESYYCEGVMEVSKHKIRCHKRIGHGMLNVSQCLEQSCNMGLIQMANAIGKDTLTRYLYNFNIGLKTNIDLAGEARTNTLVYNPENMVASDLAISSFGQGYMVNMIQMASAFSSIINGGKYYEPHVVTEIRNEDGTTIMLVTHDVKVAAKCSRVLYIVDGNIKEEYNLGKYEGSATLRERERAINNWLMDMGW